MFFGQQLTPIHVTETSNKIHQIRYRLFAVGALGTFMATLDGSILNVSLPTIANELKCSIDLVAWVALAYSMTMVSLLMVFGAWTETRGYAFAYKFGYISFLAGTCICALSGTIYTLILGRVVQATGTAMFGAVGPGMVTTIFPREERGKGIGLMVMMVAAGFMVGPPLGGILLSIWPWQWIFTVQIPVGIVGLLMTVKYFGRLERQQTARKTRFASSAAISLALVTAMFGLKLIDNYPLFDFRIWGLGVVSLIALLAFIRLERDPRHALVGFQIFRNRQFTTSIATMLTMFIPLSGVLILVPFYLENVQNLGPERVWMFLVILPVLMFIFAPLAGKASDRFGFRYLTSIGMALLAAGLFYLEQLDAGSGVDHVAYALMVVGVGIGLISTPNASALMGSVSEQERAVTSGILATTRNLGISIGIALATALFTWFQVSRADLGDESVVFISSFTAVIHVAAVIALVGVPVCLTRPNRLEKAVS
ncbi:MAG: MFS transporter [Candidatus Zixiibacteriota bacterium]